MAVRVLSNCTAGRQWLENGHYQGGSSFSQSGQCEAMPRKWSWTWGNCSLLCLVCFWPGLPTLHEEDVDLSPMCCTEHYWGGWQGSSCHVHSNDLSAELNMPWLYRCPRCRRTTFTLMKLIQHVGLIHARKSNFNITCGLYDCKSYFTLYESDRHHV